MQNRLCLPYLRLAAICHQLENEACVIEIPQFPVEEIEAGSDRDRVRPRWRRRPRDRQGRGGALG
jgi:hypothetical protein